MPGYGFTSSILSSSMALILQVCTEENKLILPEASRLSSTVALICREAMMLQNNTYGKVRR